NKIPKQINKLLAKHKIIKKGIYNKMFCIEIETKSTNIKKLEHLKKKFSAVAVQYIFTKKI
ncbi:hypothetical protein DRZ77_02340, partial [Candidatus Woesearchaeota archaeon]